MTVRAHVLWRVFCLSMLTLFASGGASPAPLTEIKIGDERRINFNDGWRFLKGEAEGAEKPGFDDSSWREVQLPHDWAIEGPFDRKYNPHCGALPFYGIGWYRKVFTLPERSKDRYFSIEFDGAMANSRVWLNGKELGGRPYGYIGFSFDLTSNLRFGGQENVVAVRLAPEDQSSRWYPGAGIYRNVWLTATGPVCVARWGTFITTPEVSNNKATVVIKTVIQNRGSQPSQITLETSINDANGKTVSRVASDRTVPAGANEGGEQKLEVPDPQRWDINRPYIYRAVSTVLDGKRVLDRYVTA
ncbi:MAG TPA: beta galactosidase jelly roll domain-containing protein, partial [Acidobacteriota bacterium]|nr:beta galactosidase jelly roll domain-containing protein [Acidobacteriota bacterium]